MHHLHFFVFIVITSGLFALLEVQIEGTAGWAAKMPTWRIENKWTRIFMGSRPLTGYHLYANLFILVIIHFPFIIRDGGWDGNTELRILAFLMLFWIMEDFLWFVFNPAFGVSKFRKEYIWWHAPQWWLFMPREYWIFGPLGLVLYVLSW